MKRTLALGMFAALLAALWLCSGKSTAGDPDDSSEPKSVNAKKAKAKFLKDLQDLEEEHASKVAKLRDQYLKKLDEVRKEVLTRDDLDEAQRIVNAKTAQQEEAKAQLIPVRGFKILHAAWGTEASWSYVTVDVRKLVKNSKLALVPEKAGFNDPAFGRHKSLVVVYSRNGKVYLTIAGFDTLVDLPPR